jgi:hypothetical protein
VFVGNSRHRNSPDFFSGGFGGLHEFKFMGDGDCILKKAFKEVAHPKKQ